MSGPDGIITIYGSFRKAKECEDGEATDPTEMPTSKQEVSASPTTFKPTVDTKQVELVTGEAAKTISIGTNLSLK
jgi:hypothetical protein